MSTVTAQICSHPPGERVRKNAWKTIYGMWRTGSREIDVELPLIRMPRAARRLIRDYLAGREG